MEETIPGMSPNLAFTGINPAANVPVGPSDWEQSEARLKREDADGFFDYLGSMWRQDGLVDGFVADLAGKELTPQRDYFAGTDPQWADLEKGLWPEHVKFLYEAHSPAHALYLKDRLLKKQEDLTRLGDLGVPGNIGRIALGFLSPDAILMGMAGGWVTRGALAVQAGRQATQLGQVLERAEQVVAASKAPAIAGGVAFGAAENAAYEYLRQGVNFEDDTAALAEAALFGGAFTAPFALAGARAAGRVAKASERELATLRALKKAEDGVELSQQEARLLTETVEVHKAIREAEEGRISPEEFNQKMDQLEERMDALFADADRWKAEFAAKLREDTDAFIAENFPNRDGRATGRNVSPAQKARMDEAVANEDLNFVGSVDVPTVAQANAKNPVIEGPQVGALKRTMEERAALRKAFEEDRAFAEKGDAEAAARVAAKEAAWAKAEADRAARKTAELERIRNAFELQRAEEDPFAAPKATNVAPKAPAPEAPAKAPESPQEAPKEATSTQAPAEPQTPPQDGLASWVGKEVSFLHAKTGETIEGRVIGVAKVHGKVIVEDGYTGNKVAVSPKSFDQYGGEMDAPEGFMPGSIGAAQVAKIASIANQRTAMSAARLDYFAILNRSEHAGIRELAFKLIKDAVQVDDKEAQGWTASEHKKHIQRVVGGRFHRELESLVADAAVAAKVPMWQRPKFKTEFYSLVSKVVRDPSGRVLQQHQPIAAQLQQAAKVTKETYAEMLELAQKAGVRGAKDVPPNDTYVNRLWDFQKIREMEELHGQDKVVEVIANAIRVPGYQGDLNKARRFLETIKKLQFSPGLRDVHLAGRDMATLRNELTSYGMNKQDIDDLVDLMFDARAAADSDAGQTARLKYRFDLDETMEVPTKAGTLRIDDLFENDARVLVDTYINTMGGHIGLAKMGIDSQATWEAKLRQIENDAAQAGGVDGRRLAKEIGYLQDIHSHITGRPISTQDFSYTARAAQALRGYTRSVMLGQLGLTAAFEMNRAIALTGLRAVWQSSPTFRGFIQALRRGYVPEPGLARDIMSITGFGSDMASSYARHHEVESGFAGGALTRFERGANVASHVTDLISGNASFTSLTRHITAQAAARDIHAYAIGLKKMTPDIERRWVGQGLDAAEIPAVLADLKTYSTDQAGVLQTIDYENWHKNEPETYEKFQLFLSRQVRDAIQDQDFGETMPWMHTTIGKILAELKTFMLVAHAKQFLKNLHYRDPMAVQMLAIALVSESLAYSTQAAINFPDQLDEKLTLENIAKAAVARASILGLTSMALEGGYSVLTGGDSFFQEGATANTDNRVPWKTPSYVVASRLFKAPATAVGLITGNDTTTQQEFKDLFRSLPASRLYGVPALLDYFASDLPRSEVVEE